MEDSTLTEAGHPVSVGSNATEPWRKYMPSHWGPPSKDAGISDLDTPPDVLVEYTMEHYPVLTTILACLRGLSFTVADEKRGFTMPPFSLPYKHGKPEPEALNMYRVMDRAARDIVASIQRVQTEQLWEQISRECSILAREWSAPRDVNPNDLPDRFRIRILGCGDDGSGNDSESSFTKEEFVRAYIGAGFDPAGLVPKWEQWAADNGLHPECPKIVPACALNVPTDETLPASALTAVKGAKETGAATRFAGHSCSDLHVVVRVACLNVKWFQTRGLGVDYSWKDLRVPVGNKMYRTLMRVAESKEAQNMTPNEDHLNDAAISRFNKRFRVVTGASGRLLSRHKTTIVSNAGGMTWGREEGRVSLRERSNQQERIDRTGSSGMGAVEYDDDGRDEDSESQMPGDDYTPTWEK